MLVWRRATTVSVTLLVATVGCAPIGGYLGARAMDLADCVKGNVGVGIGLTADVHLTDFMAPGLGIVSYTANAGYDDRNVNGVWLESIVINTPRFAFETVARDYEETPSDENLEGGVLISQLALRSLLLPNERWIRENGELTVEYYTLFNIGGLGRDFRATALTGLLQRPGERPKTPEKTIWDEAFFEAGATLGVVEARAGINPLQFLDFLAGIFGFDPADDDPPPPMIEVDPSADVERSPDADD